MKFKLGAPNINEFDFGEHHELVTLKGAWCKIIVPDIDMADIINYINC